MTDKLHPFQSPSESLNSADPDKTLTKKEVCERYRLPGGTVDLLVFQNRIPHHRIGPRLVRYSQRELDVWWRSLGIEAGSPRTRPIKKRKPANTANEGR